MSYSHPEARRFFSSRETRSLRLINLILRRGIPLLHIAMVDPVVIVRLVVDRRDLQGDFFAESKDLPARAQNGREIQYVKRDEIPVISRIDRRTEFNCSRQVINDKE